MDIGEVYSFAEGFADLCLGLGSLNGHLGGKSQPNGFSHLEAEVLSVTRLGEEFTPLAADEFASMTRLSGAHEEFLVRAVWTQEQQQLLIRTLQMVERKPVNDLEAQSEAAG